MLALLIAPAAYMHPLMMRAPSPFRSFASEFDHFFDDSLFGSRPTSTPRYTCTPRYTLAHALDQLDAPRAAIGTPRTLSALVDRLDTPRLPARPRWLEKDGNVELALHVPASSDLSVEAVEGGSLLVKATGGEPGARQWTSTLTVNLPFEVEDPQSAVEALLDSARSKLTLRIAKSAEIKPAEPQRIMLEIKTADESAPQGDAEALDETADKLPTEEVSPPVKLDLDAFPGMP